jgi:hypothetical protein
MLTTTLPMRPYSQGIPRGNATGGVGAGGLGTGATTQQQREAQRLERERNEREERERLERAGLAQLSDLSEEQREEINEAVSQAQSEFSVPLPQSNIRVGCVNFKQPLLNHFDTLEDPSYLHHEGQDLLCTNSGNALF